VNPQAADACFSPWRPIDDAMHVCLLGPIEIDCLGRQIPLSGHHQRALIAALASEAGKVVPADRLIGTLWGERPPAAAVNKLQGCVSALRKKLSGPKPAGSSSRWPIITREPGYVLSADSVTVDLFEYRALLRLAARERDAGLTAAASAHYGLALELWRGPAYADAPTEILSAMAAALESGRLLTIERRAECDLRLGRHGQVAEELGLVLAAHPARESLRAMLMLALYRIGCRADALQTYRAGRALLREQLGIEPGPVLRRLHDLILSDDPRLATPDTLSCLGAAASAAGC
jgi:DNA-binding SARP family transcriptional activator